MALLAVTVAATVVLYAGGYLAQLVGNYAIWKRDGGFAGDGTSPTLPSPAVFDCLKAVFTPPYGLYGIFICAILLALLFALVMKLGFGDKGVYDRERNLIYSRSGTYGTSGFMTEKEMEGVLDLVPVPEVQKHSGTILGLLGGKAVCVPLDTRMNANIAVFGASGSKKTRSFCINKIFSSVARGESLLITDPKSEIFEKTSAYLRDNDYVVKVFNLVDPEHSDSWNCLAEIEGQELTAQLFCDVIIKNTGSERGDHFWDNSEMNLLKALVLYVERGYPSEGKNIGEVYKLLTLSSEAALDSLFENLTLDHPAKAPYQIFKQSSESVRSGVIIGLGSRLQVFQNKLIRLITSHDEIDLELPGQQKCAYFCITSDQDSTFDFLASLFLSFAFIKLVRYADRNCPGGKLPVPVHVLGEELLNCGSISELPRRLSVIRSRNISLSIIFQNLGGLQNCYPDNQWQSILGNCDVHLFLGCTDELTATFISDRTGEASVAVTSKAKQLGTWRISDYTPEYRETSGVGRRKLLTMDEVLRLPIDEALVIIRGQKVLKVDKLDYSLHGEAVKLRDSKASEYIPAHPVSADTHEPSCQPPKQQSKPRRRGKAAALPKSEEKDASSTGPESAEPTPPVDPIPAPAGRTDSVVRTDKNSIMS